MCSPSVLSNKHPTFLGDGIPYWMKVSRPIPLLFVLYLVRPPTVPIHSLTHWSRIVLYMNSEQLSMTLTCNAVEFFKFLTNNHVTFDNLRHVLSHNSVKQWTRLNEKLSMRVIQSNFEYLEGIKPLQELIYLHQSLPESFPARLWSHPQKTHIHLSRSAVDVSTKRNKNVVEHCAWQSISSISALIAFHFRITRPVESLWKPVYPWKSMSRAILAGSLICD